MYRSFLIKWFFKKDFGEFSRYVLVVVRLRNGILVLKTTLSTQCSYLRCIVISAPKVGIIIVDSDL